MAVPIHQWTTPNSLLYPQTEYLCLDSWWLCNCLIISCAVFFGKQQLTRCKYDTMWRHITWGHVMPHDVTWHHMLFCFPKKGSKDSVKSRWQFTITMILILLAFIVTERLQRYPQAKFNSYPQLLYISAFPYSELLVSQMQAFWHS